MSSLPESPRSSVDETWCFVENTFADLTDFTRMSKSSSESSLSQEDVEEKLPSAETTTEEEGTPPVETTTKEEETPPVETTVVEEKDTPAEEAQVNEEDTDAKADESDVSPVVKQYPAWGILTSVTKQNQSNRFLETNIMSTLMLVFMLLLWFPLSIMVPGDEPLLIRLVRFSAFGRSEHLHEERNAVQAFDRRNILSYRSQKRSPIFEDHRIDFIKRPLVNISDLLPSCPNLDTFVVDMPERVPLTLMPSKCATDDPRSRMCPHVFPSLQNTERKPLSSSSAAPLKLTPPKKLLLLPVGTGESRREVSKLRAPKPIKLFFTKTETSLSPFEWKIESSNVQNHTSSASSAVFQKVANVTEEGELGAPCIKPKVFQVLLRTAASQIRDLTERLNETKSSLFQCAAARRATEDELREEKNRRAIALATNVKNTNITHGGSVNGMVEDKNLTEDNAKSESRAENCKCKGEDYAALPPSDESSDSDSSVATLKNVNRCGKNDSHQCQGELNRLSTRMASKHAAEMRQLMARYEKEVALWKAKHHSQKKRFSAFNNYKKKASLEKVKKEKSEKGEKTMTKEKKTMTKTLMLFQV